MSPKSLVLAIFSAAVLMATGCGPTYPKCDNDGHCAEKGEFCVNNLCQQCRDNSHCSGPGMACSAGKCSRKAGYCDPDIPCPGNQKCRDNECGAECLDNSECGAGTYCSAGSCIAKPECGENSDNPACPEGQECMAGRCQIKVAQCGGEAVYFRFDSADLRGDQRGKVDAIIQCLGDANAAPIRLEGHADERGTEEYNLALGERRAEAVKKYMSRKGVSGDRLSTISFGEERPAASGSNESAWGKNRRTEFSPR